MNSLHQSDPGSNPVVDVICGLTLLLVLPLAPRGFSPGTPFFPSLGQPTLSNPNSIWNERTCLNEFLRTPWWFVCKQITICNKFQTYFYTCSSHWARRKLNMAILYCGKHYQQYFARFCLRIRLLLWEKGEYSWYQCIHALTSCAPVKKKVDPFTKKVIMRGQFPHTHRDPNRHLTTHIQPSANQIHLTWSICLLTSLWFLFLITLSNCTKAWVLAVTSLLAIWEIT